MQWIDYLLFAGEICLCATITIFNERVVDVYGMDSHVVEEIRGKISDVETGFNRCGW